MAEQTPYVEDLDCGSFFDQIDDLIDFPSSDDVLSCPDGSYAQQTAATKGYDGGGSAFPPSIWAGQPGSDSVFSTNSASDLSAELSVPYEDIVQLEWLSTFVEDSFSGGGILGNIDIESSSLLLEKDLPSWSTRSQQQQSQTSSPVSVRESSSSSSGDGNPGAALSQDTNVGPRGRARSKRPRPPTFTPRPPMQHKVMKQRKQQKKMKLTTTAAAAARVDLPNQDSAADQLQGVRKCMHCQMTKTPQWRAGPTGPKTLCNACGVRFKSGRLFPEYRPAASPTFVPSLHSNSHRKVIEMRTKGTTGRLAKGATMSTTSTVVAHSQDVLIPNHNNSVAMGYL